jgi:hypothetical protein
VDVPAAENALVADLSPLPSCGLFPKSVFVWVVDAAGAWLVLL